MEQYGQKQQFICAKCGCTEFESGQFQATGGNFAKLFDVQNKNSSLFPASGAALLSFTGRKPTPAGMCLISCLAGKYFLQHTASWIFMKPYMMIIKEGGILSMGSLTARGRQSILPPSYPPYLFMPSGVHKTAVRRAQVFQVLTLYRTAAAE